MDDVAQTVQPVVYSGLQNYQCFYQFKIISCQKLSNFISILYQLKLSILKIINYLLSILYQFLYQSSSKIINISKLSILKIHNSGEGIGLRVPNPHNNNVQRQYTCEQHESVNYSTECRAELLKRKP